MSGDYKPGAVALVQNEYGVWNTAILQVQPGGMKWVYGVAYAEAPTVWPSRPLVVIDPEDREQVERLRASLERMSFSPWACGAATCLTTALREFANPTPPEPTDPKVRVTDSRDNIWRLLADGDWVCTSGPDIGEYLVWWQLAGRGGRAFPEGFTDA